MVPDSGAGHSEAQPCGACSAQVGQDAELGQHSPGSAVPRTSAIGLSTILRWRRLASKYRWVGAEASSRRCWPDMVNLATTLSPSASTRPSVDRGNLCRSIRMPLHRLTWGCIKMTALWSTTPGATPRQLIESAPLTRRQDVEQPPCSPPSPRVPPPQLMVPVP